MARAKNKTLADINAQIEQLQKEAATLLAAEVSAVIGRIKEAIAHYGLTAEDLGFVARRGRQPGRKAAPPATATVIGTTAAKAKRGAKATKRIGVIKYDDGAGHTWTGRGTRPRWYLDALKSGRTAEDLMLKAAT